MKKSFMTRVLATGLSVAMAFSLSTATNLVSAQAASKPVLVDYATGGSGKTMTVNVDETAKIKVNAATKKNYKIASVKKSSAKIKTAVNKAGTVVTVRGKIATEENKPAAIKVSFKAKKTGKTSKYTFTSKVTVVAEEEPKTDAFEMTSLKATSANVLTATFANAVASEGAVKIKVTKAGSTTEITGTTKWSEDLTSVAFTASAKFTTGTYEMTATDAADSTKTTSKTAEVENEKVTEIKILNEVALTNKARTEAYIYYDVVNQYGESLRNSSSVTWTVSTDTTPKVNKATGKITATTSGTNTYIYGNAIYVTGVYNKTGVTVQKELKIGMEQGLDSVKSCGFVKDTDKNTILSKLPKNFQAGQYKLLYQAFDQNGNQLDTDQVEGCEATGSSSADVTFVSDNALLIKNDFHDDQVYTIDGLEYNSVTIEPGQYVDKGGEVNITAIANKTGTKTVMNYVIETGALLKSVVLSQPSTVIADGETSEIPFVATDVDGNKVTNYESIARTTNTLSLTASEGLLSIVEKADGTAKFVYSDRAIGWDNGSTYDNVSRSIALTTVVVGGDSNNLILTVDDKARPVAVKSVNFRDNATTAVVGLDSNTIDYKDFTFVDQYGRTMSRNADGTNNSNGFLEYISKPANAGKWHDSYYAIKAEFNKSGSNFGITTAGGVGMNQNVSPLSANNAILLSSTAGAFTWDAADVDAVANESVKWSVASTDKADDKYAADEYNYCDKTMAVSYSVVPMTKVSNITINSTDKQYVNLGLGDYATGAEAGLVAENMTEALKDATNISTRSNYTAGTANVTSKYYQTLGVSASYQGTKVVVPSTYVEWESSKLAIVPDNTVFPNSCGAIIGVSTGAMKLGDFFDAKAANFARKDASASVTARVYSVSCGGVDRKAKHISYSNAANVIANNYTISGGWTVDSASAIQLAAPTVNVAISDANPGAAKIELVGETDTVAPARTVLVNTRLTNHNKAFGTTAKCVQLPRVFDQYNKELTGADVARSKWTFTVSDIKESTSELTHLDKSFTVYANATSETNIEGAEIGDTFTLTYKIGSASATLKLTVDADEWAKITSTDDYDKTFRTEDLSYAY